MTGRIQNGLLCPLVNHLLSGCELRQWRCTNIAPLPFDKQHIIIRTNFIMNKTFDSLARDLLITPISSDEF